MPAVGISESTNPQNASFSDSLPVFFWIHGGGFLVGNPQMADGIYDNLVNRGPMLLVSIAYRLGAFGFFTTRDPAAPGNFAMSDWIVGLQWVQRFGFCNLFLTF